MKKKFKTLLLVAVLIAACFGCKKDDDNSNNPSVANFAISGDNEFAPRAVIFSNQSLNATSYLWNFGDGQTSTAENPNHVFNAGGTYNVTLTATNSVGQNVVNKTVIIKNAPSKLKITRIVLTSIPFINSSGSGWDTYNGPDVYFKLSDDASTAYFTSGGIFNDLVSSTLPVAFTTGFPFTIIDLDYNFIMGFWDQDSPDADDYMAGFYFKVRTKMPTDGSLYPATIVMQSATNGLNFTLNVEWLP
ncbi:MAG: PKD domain-containing protein [Bacteroidetes bacterium]|nr:PKD domain-containing protein [Bacteroidota bacterium]